MVLTLTPGETLRIARLRREMSQEQLAELIGCSPKHISQIEAGKVQMIGLDLAFAIQREFEIPADSWLAEAASA